MRWRNAFSEIPLFRVGFRFKNIRIFLLDLRSFDLMMGSCSPGDPDGSLGLI